MSTVLYVTEIFPDANGGAGVATIGVLRALQAGGWNVHLIVNVRPCDEEKLERARSLCTQLTPICRPRMRIPPLGAWLRTFRRFGYAPRWQEAMWRAVDGALRAGGVSLVLLDHIRAAEYGRLAKEAGHRVPVALREHNVEHVLNARLAPEMESGQKRIETRVRAARYAAIESNLARYCDLVLPISPVDGAKLASANPGFPSVVIPSPVDTARYRPAGAPRGKEIVFVGGMGYGPNRDAVTWFVNEVLPAVLARHPDARFTAVGEKPPRWFADHAPHVSAPGFVPDERVYLERARVFVTPVRYGSGVRTKILNAMAMRRPVVATSSGAEGLELERGREILIEDEALGFARAVNLLLEDDGRAEELAEAGLRAVLAGYAPGAVAHRLRATVESAAAYA